MERVSIEFVDDGGLIAHGATLEHLRQHAPPELSVQETGIEEIRVGPIVYIPGEVIVAGIGALSAVVSALLTYIATRRSGKIVLKGKDGRSVEIPRDVKRDDVEFYIEKAKELDVDRVTIYNKDG
jgi:hypothetical protein